MIPRVLPTRFSQFVWPTFSGHNIILIPLSQFPALFCSWIPWLLTEFQFLGGLTIFVFFCSLVLVCAFLVSLTYLVLSPKAKRKEINIHNNQTFNFTTNIINSSFGIAKPSPKDVKKVFNIINQEQTVAILGTNSPQDVIKRVTSRLSGTPSKRAQNALVENKELCNNAEVFLSSLENFCDPPLPPLEQLKALLNYSQGGELVEV